MEPEPCTICLEALFTLAQPNVTRLQPCSHYYHPECISLWRERSNQCPTCRRDYVFMEALTQQGQVIASEVADRVEVEPLQEEIFQAPTGDENMILPRDQYALLELRIERQVARSNRCALCDSSRGQVLSCNSCSSTFHGGCLGLGQERIAQWLCPMCGAEQGTYQPPSIFRMSRFSERTNRVYNSLMSQPSSRTPLMSGPAMTEHVVERPQMSPEEKVAWDAFELARKESEQAGSSSSDMRNNTPQPQPAPPQSPDAQRKQKLPSRRRRAHMKAPDGHTTLSTDRPQQIQPQSSGSSLINSLLGQMSQRPPVPQPSIYPYPPHPYQHPSSTRAGSMSSQSSSPTQSVTSLSTSPESPSSLYLPPKSQLTFEQKTTLQQIVRSQLRPVYTDGKINEDQYTQINMKVSRILYDACLQSSEAARDDFEELARRYVEEEVRGFAL